MPIVRRTRAEIDKPKLLSELAARRSPSEQEIQEQAAEDGDAWSDADMVGAEAVYPPPSPEEVKALRKRLGIGQRKLAQLLGLSFEEVQQYEQGVRHPSGPEAVLLRVVTKEPRAVMRALNFRKAS
jgi:putative transcriptional regulator